MFTNHERYSILFAVIDIGRAVGDQPRRFEDSRVKVALLIVCLFGVHCCCFSCSILFACSFFQLFIISSLSLSIPTTHTQHTLYSAHSLLFLAVVFTLFSHLFNFSSFLLCCITFLFPSDSFFFQLQSCTCTISSPLLFYPLTH